MKSAPILGFALLLGACASSPPVQFFTLDPVPGSHQAGDLAGAPVQVGAVHVPPVLDRQQMVSQNAPNALTISDRNRWGGPMAQMVRDVLTQDLIQRLPKDQVVLPDSAVPPGTSVIAVDILEFQRTAAGAVIFNGSWSLSAAGSDAPISVRHVLLSVQAEPDDFPGQAAAMSKLLALVANEMAGALATSRPERPSERP